MQMQIESVITSHTKHSCHTLVHISSICKKLPKLQIFTLLYDILPLQIKHIKKKKIICGGAECVNEIQTISTAYFYFSEKGKKIKVCLVTNFM